MKANGLEHDTCVINFGVLEIRSLEHSMPFPNKKYRIIYIVDIVIQIDNECQELKNISKNAENTEVKFDLCRQILQGC